MHEMDRSGVIAGTREQLAQVCRCQAVHVASAIEELDITGAADVTERNGVVTVVCRRMKREAKARKDSMLRVQKHRGNASVTHSVTDMKQTHARAPSESEDGSVLSQNGGSSAVGGVELPPRWPKSAEEAVQMKPVASKASDELVRTCWLQGASRGGRDFGGNVIASFWHYVEARVETDRGRAAEKAALNGGNGSGSLRTVHELRTIREAKQRMADDLKNRWTSEVATGRQWDDPQKRDMWKKLVNEIKEIDFQISGKL